MSYLVLFANLDAGSDRCEKAMHCYAGQTNLSGKIDAGKNEILGILVQDTEAEVCSLKE